MNDLIKHIDKRNIFFSIITGLMLTASFPEIGFDFLIWFALIPLLWVINQTSSVFYLGCLAGFVHQITLVYWLNTAMHEYGHLPIYTCIPLLILLCLYLSIFLGLFCVLIKRICLTPFQLLLAPFFWVTLDYLRSLTQFAFPWEFLGYSQYTKLPLIQIADITGVYGISWLIVFFNIAIVLFLLHTTGQKWQSSQITILNVYLFLGCLIGLFVVFLSYGVFRIYSIDKAVNNHPNSLNVSVIQGNIDQSVKWDESFRLTTVQKYIQLSQSDDNIQPDIIVWPETAVPVYIQQQTPLSELIRQYVQKQKSAFLIGGLRYDKDVSGQWHFYNSMFLLHSTSWINQTYDKTHLVPYGEYIPFQTIFPFLKKLVEGVGQFSEGQNLNPLTLNQWAAGPQICYEILFPNLSRILVQKGADILVNITNDAWYGWSSAPYQHFSMVVFRAIENKRSIARSANTGVSGCINPFGKILGSTDIFTEARLTCTLPVLNEKTIYTRFGDVFAMMCVVISVIMLLYHCIFRKTAIKSLNYPTDANG